MSENCQHLQTFSCESLTIANVSMTLYSTNEKKISVFCILESGALFFRPNSKFLNRGLEQALSLTSRMYLSLLQKLSTHETWSAVQERCILGVKSCDKLDDSYGSRNSRAIRYRSIFLSQTYCIMILIEIRR